MSSYYITEDITVDKRFLCLFIALFLICTVFVGCGRKDDTVDKPTDADTAPSHDETLKPEFSLNGNDLSDYTIIYSEADADYAERAAHYVRDKIAEKTGITLAVKSDKEQPKPSAHEIVVGETKRAISDELNEDTTGFSFSIMANGDHVAMEGDYFVIAAAAYYFVETYVKDEPFSAVVPTEAAVHEPIVKDAENYVFMIGDGMGFNQTLLFNTLFAKNLDTYSDGEKEFYGYMFPYQGAARTSSLSGTTDSAAAGTALSSGYKTINRYLGKDKYLKDVKSLTEIALELGKATAVMSTETQTGATPAAFSVHIPDRDDTEDIKAAQNKFSEETGTLILGGYGSKYTQEDINKVEDDLLATLATLSEDEDGFFMMYEEAYIDKHSHSNEMENTYLACLRFNQAIGTVMEFAFYNPDTFVLITADHETGGLTKQTDTMFYYTSPDHTNKDVPVFAYGVGAEAFGDTTVENIQIPKSIAALWGVTLDGYDNANYPSLIPVK